MSKWYDIGSGHAFSKVVDDDGSWIAIDERHQRKDNPSVLCAGGFIPFDNYPEKYKTQGTLMWKKTGDETTLTLSPSLACRGCGSHGWIENGKWREA